MYMIEDIDSVLLVPSEVAEIHYIVTGLAGLWNSSSCGAAATSYQPLQISFTLLSEFVSTLWHRLNASTQNG